MQNIINWSIFKGVWSVLVTSSLLPQLRSWWLKRRRAWSHIIFYHTGWSIDLIPAIKLRHHKMGKACFVALFFLHGLTQEKPEYALKSSYSNSFFCILLWFYLIWFIASPSSSLFSYFSTGSDHFPGLTTFDILQYKNGVCDAIP